MTRYLTKVDKPFSRTTAYGHATGMVMTRESTLLDEVEVQRMLYSDYREAMGIALDSACGHHLEGAVTAADIEAGLGRFLEEQYRFMDDACGGTPVSEFMHLKYDFHNLRVLLKRRHLGEDVHEELFSALGTVDLEAIGRALDSGGSTGVPACMAEPIETVGAAAEAGRLDAQLVDTVVDRAFLERRLDIALDVGSTTLEAFCRASIDVANLTVMLRGMSLGKAEAFYEAALCEGGKLPGKELLSLTGRPFSDVTARLLNTPYGQILAEAVNGEERARLTSLDRASDDFLMEKVRSFSVISVGPERIVAYMMAREREIAVLRIILVGKISGLPTGAIEARLPTAFRKSAGT